MAGREEREVERRGKVKEREPGIERDVDEFGPNELTTLWLVLCTFVACFGANQMCVCMCVTLCVWHVNALAAISINI